MYFLVKLATSLGLKDPVLPIKHCMLQSPGGHFCYVENSEVFVYVLNSTL